MNKQKLVKLLAGVLSITLVFSMFLSYGLNALAEGVTTPTDLPEVTEKPTDPTTPSDLPTPAPTEKPADPTEKPADPTEKPADPTEKPADPTEKPADPTEKPADPTEKPADPTEKPADPTEKPADPTEKPADPTEKPADPTEKPTDKPVYVPTVTEEPAPEVKGEQPEVEAVAEVVATVLTEEEQTKVSQLTKMEQKLVYLSAAGLEDVVKAAVETLKLDVSEDCTAVIAGVAEKINAMTEEEKTALVETMTKLFPVVEVKLDGQDVTVYVVELPIEENGVETTAVFGIYLNAEGEWAFVTAEEMGL